MHRYQHSCLDQTRSLLDTHSRVLLPHCLYIAHWHRSHRYLLHIHRNGVDAAVANRLADLFNRSPGFTVIPAKRKHRQFEVMREQ